jgi:hypothetical protein
MSAKKFNLLDPSHTLEDLRSPEFAARLTAAFGAETKRAARAAMDAGIAPGTTAPAPQAAEASVQTVHIGVGRIAIRIVSRTKVKVGVSGGSWIGKVNIANFSSFVPALGHAGNVRAVTEKGLPAKAGRASRRQDRAAPTTKSKPR